jgi:YfiH family protein
MPDSPIDAIPLHDLITPDWLAPGNVRAFSTTRKCGFSKGKWGQLNLGAHCGDNPEHVYQNRGLLQALLPSSPRWLRQVHGTAVADWSDTYHPDIEADAIVSSQPGQVCAVLTADCLPVLFCNRRGDRVGIAHAGWRGLANGILEATVRALDETPTQLMAWMGPAIGPQVYEVGADVAEAFPGEFPAGFTPRGDRFLMDIYALAKLKLAAVGVHAVYGGAYCTLSDSGRFFSYRRDGVTGRMASLIWLDQHESEIKKSA